MYSAITQIKLTRDVILSPLKFEQQSFDKGFQFKFLWIFHVVRSAGPGVECLFRFVDGFCMQRI